MERKQKSIDKTPSFIRESFERKWRVRQRFAKERNTRERTLDRRQKAITKNKNEPNKQIIILKSWNAILQELSTKSIFIKLPDISHTSEIY